MLILLPLIVFVVVLVALVTYLVARAQRRRATTGAEGLVGEIARAETALAPAGKVFVHGEYWNAASDTPVAAGESGAFPRWSNDPSDGSRFPGS